jgi:hypothetical protein
MANLKCEDDRILKICAELFTLLKSNDNSKIIHKKEVNVRSFSTGSKSASITIGFLNFQMIWKPMKMTTTGNSGSDEGASVFINVPFFKGATEDIIKTTSYYSERNNMSTLTVLDSKNLNKNTQRRVTYKQNIDTTPPV